MTPVATNHRLVRMKEAAVRKYGNEKEEHTLAAHQYLQPWAGFSYRDGRRKFWPDEDVEVWTKVFAHNRAQYYYTLLHRDPREEVRIGVREQLLDLKARGLLPESYHYLLEAQP